ncbi:MATE family efflux transporter [Clostridium tarantellae]|uniref:Multidrug export protein MepA n=1 Tax=Clostridium tarantellae TaxID=39493 RepID=A0A6I1MQU7_9CLOT|nr:MATE family efflux transporter [Clostridium tarantellae]MPQ44828.1 MATE family efflux transporter [Clostridium tarantellae]
MKQQKLLGEESIGNLLIKYSVPAIIGMLVNALYNIVDRAFIGRIPDVGQLAITGVGITMPIAYILLAFGMLIGIGTTANMSIKLGQGKKKEVEKLIGNSLTLTIIIGVIITILGLVFVDPMLKAFGAGNNTLIFAKEYIIIILLGSIFNLISFSLNSTIRADGSPKVAATTMIIGCLLNTIMDPIFIFIFKWGIKGAALSTVLSQAIVTVIILYYYTKGKSNFKLKKENLKLDTNLVKCILAIGVAPFSMQIAASVVQIVSNNALKLYGGDLAIGAMTVISSISMIFMMPTFGINQGAQPIIGFNYGAKKYNRAKLTFKYATIVACTILTIGFVLIRIFPEQCISIFNKDSALLNISIDGLKIYLCMMPLIGIQIVGSNYFQSIGKAKLSMFLSLLRQVILLIPLILILPKAYGLTGIWLAGAMSDFISTIITIVFLVKEFKNESKENITLVDSMVQ